MDFVISTFLSIFIVQAPKNSFGQNILWVFFGQRKQAILQIIEPSIPDSYQSALIMYESNLQHSIYFYQNWSPVIDAK